MPGALSTPRVPSGPRRRSRLSTDGASFAGLLHRDGCSALHSSAPALADAAVSSGVVRATDLRACVSSGVVRATDSRARVVVTAFDMLEGAQRVLLNGAPLAAFA